MNKIFHTMTGAAFIGLMLYSVGFSQTGGRWQQARALPQKKGVNPVMVQVGKGDGDVISLRYAVPELVVENLHKNQNGKTVKRIILGNAPLTALEGEPVLPVIPSQFVIPAGREIDKIRVIRGNRIPVSGEHVIEHGAATIPLLPKAKKRVAVQKRAIYDSDNPFPGKSHELVTVQKKRGVSIGIVNIHPVTYHPKTGRIFYYSSIVLTITTKPVSRGYTSKIRRRPQDLNPATIGVENPEALDTYEEDRGSGSAAPAGSGVPLGICDPADSYQYVIVTSQAIRDATTDVTVRDLITQKQSRGLTATIVTIEEVYASYTGVDNAERLRNFIIDAYNSWEADFILLGGDVNIIPLRYLYTDATTIPSDLYYQCLDGSYNSDGDSYWGEYTDGPGGTDVDLMAEVFIGRASAENETEMSNFVFKTLAYENESESAPYLRSALIAGEYLGSQFGPGEFSYAAPLMDEIINGASTAGYTTAGFSACPSFTTETLYDYTSTWPASVIIGKINSNNYGVINHLGHANTDYVFKFYNADADALTNTNFLFAYSQGCIPGDFSADCMAEHLTTSTRHGMFAVVFNSRYGWGAYNDSRATLDAPSHRFDRQFWDAYFGEYIFNLGAINADSHEDNIWDINGGNIRWCYYETNLLGDPQTVLRGQVTGPSVAYASHNSSDSAGGNGDGLINPDEDISINAALMNVGSDPAEGVEAVLSSTDTNVSIVDNTALYGDIPCCGASRDGLDDFVIHISSGCPTPHTVTLDLAITDIHSETWNASFQVTVYTSSQVSGYVTALTGGAPVSGAVVEYSGPLSGTVTTNASGYYMFGGIDGTYSVFVQQGDYLQSDTQSVTVPPDVANVNFSLCRPQMGISPSQINESCTVGEQVTADVNITNNGDFPLEFEIFSIDVTSTMAVHKKESIVHDLTRYPLDSLTENGNGEITSVHSYVRSLVPEHKLGEELTVLIITNSLLPGYMADILQALNSGEGTLQWSITSDSYLYSEIASIDFDNYDVLIINGWSTIDCYSSYLLAESVKFQNFLNNSSKTVIISWADQAYCTSSPIDISNLLPAGNGNCSVVGNFNDGAVCYIYPGHETHELLNNPNQITNDDIDDSWSWGPTRTYYSEIPNGSLELTYRSDNSSTTLFTSHLNSGSTFIGAGYVFGDNHYNGTPGGDLEVKLFENILYYAQNNKVSWLSTDPSSGTVLPGSSMTVSVTMDATQLLGGTYSGRLDITHNDPSSPNPASVPVTLSVDGFRRLSISPVDLDFGNVWSGTSDSLTIILTNNGDELTTVTNITSDNGEFSFSGSLPVTIPAFESVDIAIQFSPADIGAESGTLTITSDAEDNPSIDVALNGTGVEPPGISVSPMSITESAPVGSSVDVTLTVTNTGGDDLVFTPHGAGNLNYPPVAENLNVLFLTTGISYQSTFVSEIRDLANIGNLDTLDGSTTTPNLTYLLNYDVVIVASCQWSSWLSAVTTGDVLADYVDAGGRVVLMCETFISGGGRTLGGRIMTSGYSPLAVMSGSTGTATSQFLADHPINRNVSSIFTGIYVFNTAPQGNGISLGTYPGDYLVGAVNYEKPVVGLNISPVNAEWSGDVLTMVENTLDFLATNGWLLIANEGEAVTVPQGQSVPVLVTLDATNLYGGTYTGLIEFAHNDPATPNPLTIPVSFYVDGTRMLSAAPTTLDFGDVWSGTSDSMDVILTNSGNELTTVTNINSSNDEFSFAGSLPISVPAFQSVTIAIRFSPVNVGAESGTLTIISDAEDNPEITVSLAGTGVLAPEISVTPMTINQVLMAGDTSIVDLTISNTGGAPLDYTIASRTFSLVTPLPDKVVVTADQMPTPNDSDNVHSNTGNSFIEYSGDHLHFGITQYGEIMPLQYPIGTEHLRIGSYISGYLVAYTIGAVDHVYYANYSSQLGIVPVSYTEIENSATRLEVDVVVQTTDSILEITRNFVFEKSDKYIRITTNISNSSDSLVENVVLKSFADWDIDGATLSNIFDWDENHSMIYAYQTHFAAIAGERAPDYRDIYGWNDYTVRATDEEYTEGPITIDGLEVLHYELGQLPSGSSEDLVTAFAAGDDFIELQEVVERAINYSQWLSVPIASGTVPGGSSSDVDVIFDARALIGGTYNGELEIAHNAPSGENPVMVACNLTVEGFRSLTVSPTSYDFGSVWAGLRDSTVITLTNDGSAAATVSDITSDNAEFINNATLPITVPPFESVTFDAIFAPVDVGAESGTLTIISDAEDNPEITVALSGTGTAPPDITVSPAYFHEILDGGDSVTHILTIDNTGGAPLDYSIEKTTPLVKDDTLPNFSDDVAGYWSFDEGIGDTAHDYSGNSNHGIINGALWDDGIAGHALTFDGITNVIRIEDSPSLDITDSITIEAWIKLEKIASDHQVIVAKWYNGGSYSFSFVLEIYPYTQRPQLVLYLSTGRIENLALDDIPLNEWTYVVGTYDGTQSRIYVDGILSNQLLASGTITPGISPLMIGAHDYSGDRNPFDGTIDEVRILNRALTQEEIEARYNSFSSEWLIVTPTSGTVLPGEDAEVSVTFKAWDLIADDYWQSLAIYHNAPTPPSPFAVPCTLTVNGYRRLTASPTSYDFGNLWVGLRDSVEITLTNNGSEATTISNVISDNAEFMHNATLPITVQPFESVAFDVIFAPVDVGAESGTLTIISDAEDNPTLTVALSGTGTEPPSAELDPTSFTFNLSPSDAPADATSVLSNGGGDVLSWQITSVQQTGSPLDVSQQVPRIAPVDLSKIYASKNYTHAFSPGRVIVGLKTGKTTFADHGLLAALNVKDVRELATAVNPKTGLRSHMGRTLLLVELSDQDGVLDAINSLKQDDNVAYAEPDYIRKLVAVPNDPSFSLLYGMHNEGQTGGTPDADIDATEAWDRHTGNTSVIVGLIDTGIDYLHPDLADNVWVNTVEQSGTTGVDDDGNGYIDDIYGYDFINNDSDPWDDHYHGSHCAGTIGGVGNNGIGVAGVCWTVKTAGAKIFNSAGSTTDAAILNAVDYTNAMGFKITSNSWGGGPYSQSLKDLIDEAGTLGHLFIAAAGNDGLDNDVYPHYPSSYDSDNIIAVAATDHNDGLASFSCYGLTSVDLGAPGVDIYSCQPGGGYQYLSGTSMATPHVSGAAALVWSFNPSLSASDVKDALMNSVDPIAALSGRAVTGGRLNVNQALDEAGPNWLAASPLTPGTLNPGETQDITTTVNPAGLVAGTWTGQITVTTDDPANQELTIDVTANISGCKNLIVTPASYDFGDVYVGTEANTVITLTNDCNAVTTVSSISFDNADFSHAATLPLQVQPFSEVTFAIAFNPSGAGGHSAVMTLNTDADTDPVKTVSLSGTGVLPPEVAVSPPNITRNLVTDEVATVDLDIVNSGGSILNWTLSGVEQKFASPIPYDASHFVELPKGAVDTRIGRPVVLNGGGPDAFGYTWKDSDEPGGPAYVWDDISATGSILSTVSGCDDCYQSQTLSFLFPFYGNNFSAIYVSSNGYITLGAGSSQIGNYPLPSTLAPANLIASLHDDLNPGSSGTIYFQDYGDKAVVQFDNVRAYDGSGYYTYQMVLEDNGTVTFYYNNLTGTLNGCTVGIQNSTRDIGLTVAYNTTYLKNNLAVQFKSLPEWLHVSDTAGTVNPGETQTLTVTLDATGLEEDTYAQTMTLNHNDPLQGPIDIPVLMTVSSCPGEPHIALSSNAFNQILPPESSGDQILTVTNDGTCPLTADLSLSLSSFSQAATTGVDIPPDVIKNIRSSAGIIPGLSSNDNTVKPVQGEIVNNISPTGGNNVLLFRDNLPWGYDVNVPLLQTMGANVTTAASSQMSSIDLTSFDVIIFASQQPNYFYTAYVSNLSRFEDFLNNGGNIEFHAAAYTSDRIPNLPLPGGMTTLSSADLDNYNYVVNTSHPITSGLDSTLEGSSASHEAFANIPLDGNILIRNESGLPTTVEYNFGNGKVVATGMTWEFGYGNGYTCGDPLPNALQFSLVAQGVPPWIVVDPLSISVPSGDFYDINLAFSSFDIEVGTYFANLSIEHNGTNEPTPINIPITLQVRSEGFHLSRVLNIGTAATPVARGSWHSLLNISVGGNSSGLVKGTKYKLLLK